MVWESEDGLTARFVRLCNILGVPYQGGECSLAWHRNKRATGLRTKYSTKQTQTSLSTGDIKLGPVSSASRVSIQ